VASVVGLYALVAVTVLLAFRQRSAWWPYYLWCGVSLDLDLMLVSQTLHSFRAMLGAAVLRGHLACSYMYLILAPFLWQQSYVLKPDPMPAKPQADPRKPAHRGRLKSLCHGENHLVPTKPHLSGTSAVDYRPWFAY
jgi:hypothetical protein